ncbi:DMT family transporter [Variovorax sp. VNK109]|jgi:drug/metabolite transporter (DMT)-like permease|uniref:DMT family transporter n=1 Tax=Variovorax sp. VNK109 TaxID=3400919 RepID=UPI003C059AF2
MTQRKTELDTFAITLLVACCMFWGLQQILIKSIVTEVPPLWQATMRFVGATALLMGWCAWRGIRLFEKDGTLPGGLLTGSLFLAEFTCIYLGLRDTTASRLTVFLYTSPFIVALLLPRFIPTERLRGWQWVGLVLAFCAVAFAFSEGFSHTTARQLRGDALALLGGACWGLSTIVIRTTKMATASAEKALFYQIAVTAAGSPLISLALGEKWSFSYSGWAWTSLGLQTFIGAFASYLAWMWMIRHYPATKVSSFVFLTPVFGLICGVLFLKEPLTVQLVLALAAVAVGIVLVNRKPAA